MKRLAGIVSLALGVVFLVGIGKARANEGTALLSGPSTNSGQAIGDGRCFIASVLVDEGDYRILLTCENLTLPPSAEKLFYHVWAKKASATDSTTKPGGKFLGRSSYLSFGVLQNGKLSARAREAFTDVFVTSEKESGPSEPNMSAIVVGSTIQSIDFDTGKTTQVRVQPTTSVPQVTLMPTARPAASTTAGRSVVGTAFRVFLTIIGIVVVVAVVISLIQRRSASK